MNLVAAALVRGRRVLLGHRAATRCWYPDVWDLPGGHVLPGEEPGAALVRELDEELGITVDEPRSLPIEISRDDMVMRIWVIDRWVGTVRNAAPDEHDELGWFALADIGGLALADPSYREVLAGVLAGPRRHLCILLAGPVADEVEELRRRFDPVMAAVAPAHVTLTYPEESGDEALLLRRMASCARERSPFRLRLGAPFVEDGGVFLAVEDVDGVWEGLRRDLLVPPFCPLDVPAHVTLVHPRTSRQVAACMAELAGRRTPESEIEVGQLCYTETSSTFTVLERFPLVRDRPRRG
jgi:8-oxo-dGTP pyrophosphatase MutT (NUDIX family)